MNGKIGEIQQNNIDMHGYFPFIPLVNNLHVHAKKTRNTKSFET